GASPATSIDRVWPGASTIPDAPDESTGPSWSKTSRLIVEVVEDGLVTVSTAVVPVVVVAPGSQCSGAAGVQAAVAVPARSPAVAAYCTVPAAAPGGPPTGWVDSAMG